MYLSNLKLWNFRKFGSGGDSLNLANPDITIPFTTGLSVLIGENDSGKTAIIDAIKLILDTHSSEWVKVDIDDFYKNSTRLESSVALMICLMMKQKTLQNGLEWRGKAMRHYLI